MVHLNPILQPPLSDCDTFPPSIPTEHMCKHTHLDRVQIRYPFIFYKGALHAELL